MSQFVLGARLVTKSNLFRNLVGLIYTLSLILSVHFLVGVLIDAMRKGYWIVLDELNLAPTDVLEALNRLLDDNRELLITETQEVVKAHPRFMLFATQNPPGLYGGRKVSVLYLLYITI